ncbi:hypothetical protein AB0D11_02330 [Streptomyces monashensis]|uniref:hypothetical protein n=1 Tax=Streptomyces monashensis TaxID=1678012 RepID=UPI00340F80A2
MTQSDPSEQLTGLRSAMTAIGTDPTTPEQRAEQADADRELARRVHAVRPGVPLHHVFAVVQALRAVQTVDALVAPPADRAVLSDTERQFLTYALDLAADHVAFRPDEFTDADRAAMERLRRLAGEAPQDPAPGGELAFVTRVLELFSLSHADLYDGGLFWRVDDGKLSLYANVSDVFAWGGADAEPITPDTLPALEKAFTDLKAIDADLYTAELYAARQRGERPQGAAYPDDKHQAWRQISALFDACGPERPLGLGNPKAAPAHVARPGQPETDTEATR